MGCLMSKTIASSLNPIFHLPEDLIIEILSRLPVKSLVRFSVVCKAWKALIENPIFISKHLKQNHNNLNFSYLIVTYSEHENSQSPNRHMYDYAMYLHSGNALDPIINLDFPFLGEYKNFAIVGVCNGLVCISYYLFGFHDLVICNPSTRHFTKVPNFHAIEAECLEAVYGFAFDSSSDDYKIISLTLFTDYKLNDKAGVYTLSTNSWREIVIDVPIDEDLMMNLFSIGPTVLLDGVFYWECYMYPSCNNAFVLSFNMIDESFGLISGPDGFNGVWHDDYWKCVQLKQELAIFAFTSERCFVVWTLNPDSVSWKLKYVIGTMPVVAIPTGVEDVGDIILVGSVENGDVIYVDCTSSDTQLFFYDLDSGEIKRLPFVDIEDCCQVFGYTESLIPVKENEF